VSAPTLVSGPVQRIVEAIYNYWPNALANLATIGLAAMGVWLGFQPHHWHLVVAVLGFVGFGVVYAFGEWRSYSRRGLLTRATSRVTELEYALEQADDRLFSLFREQLRILAAKLAFTDRERISAFRYDEDAESFRLVGRFAKDPTFNTPGRQAYPSAQGCLAKAWRTGEAIADLPDRRVDEPAYFAKLLDDWDIPREVAERFTMTCRTMVAFALEDDRGDHLAILVFESERPNAFDLQKVRLEMRTERRRLSIFIQESTSIERADAQVASRAGF
jgi:hypothetical protein